MGGILVIAAFVLIIGGAISIGLALSKKREKRMESAPKIDYKSQINDIISKVVPNNMGQYKAVTCTTQQTTGEMLKDSVVETAVRAATGIRFFSHYDNKQFLVLFGSNEMYFLNYEMNKGVIADCDNVMKLGLDDVSKLKIKSEGKELKFSLKDGSSFLITISPLFMCEIYDINDFKEFIKGFAEALN